MKRKKAQISIEYILIVGFASFVVIGILGLALFYSATAKDRIKAVQIEECAKKIVSEAESVFYYGSPSKTTVLCHLPENVKQIDIIEDSLIFSTQTSSGIMKTAFSSKVPIQGNITAFSGARNLKITAQEDYVLIALA